jgi:hypothetical protein
MAAVRCRLTEQDMDYVKPTDIVAIMIDSARAKAVFVPSAAHVPAA